MREFNIFEVLEKDDKELIHSSFIKFLLSEDNIFHEKFLNIKNVKFDKTKLEKTYIVYQAQKNTKNKIDTGLI